MTPSASLTRASAPGCRSRHRRTEGLAGRHVTSAPCREQKADKQSDVFHLVPVDGGGGPDAELANALVTSALFCRRILPVSTSIACMNGKHCPTLAP